MTFLIVFYGVYIYNNICMLADADIMYFLMIITTLLAPRSKMQIIYHFTVSLLGCINGHKVL